MADEIVKELAASTRGLVIAPAGCGKTHLISEAVKHCKGRQLILTHTHAGVKAIRDRMVLLGVPANRYRVSTIDSFALRYAVAFPTLSSWAIRRPEDGQWQQLRPAAAKVFKAKFAEDVLRASYSGVFVDEYQDCTVSQHELILQLASVFPCRVLGDDLQAIFWKINEKSGEALSWKRVVESFPPIGTLDQPHRWINKDGETSKNEDLGRWLLTIRELLKAGKEIELEGAPGVTFYACSSDMQNQIASCQKALMQEGKIIALRKWMDDCHKIAGEISEIDTFEDAQGKTLLNWARNLDKVEGNQKVELLRDFADRWLKGFPKQETNLVIKAVLKRETIGVMPDPSVRLFDSLVGVRDDTDCRRIAPVLDAFESLAENPIFKSREIWFGLRQAALLSSPLSGQSLHQAAWDHREHIRKTGRHPPERCLSTPLLVKGLECDHMLILDAADFPDAESLYVCLTRASRSVTILATSSKIMAAPVARSNNVANWA